MTPHIEAEKKDISKLVLMPGDPVRASYIAKNFLTDYKLVNGIRGMTAYTGYYKDVLVTIFPSGMGIPSMGIYSYELFKFYDVGSPWAKSMDSLRNWRKFSSFIDLSNIALPPQSSS